LSRDGSALIDTTSTLRAPVATVSSSMLPPTRILAPNFRQQKYPYDRLPPHWQ
jgi:hypothetical protein